MQAYLSVSVREQGQSVLIEVDGELDLASSPQLETAIEHAWRDQPELVMLDLRNLRFIDMAGLRVLLTAQEQAEREGNELVLANVPQAARRVMELARVEDLLKFVDTPA